MKKLVSFLIILTSVILISCGGSGSRATAEASTPIPVAEKISPPPPKMTEEQKAEREPFGFWAKMVKVEPMVINQDDTWGEGQEPSVTMRFVFYFVDSAGNEKPWIVNESYPKTKTANNSAEYKLWVDDFNKSKALYEKITQMPEGSIYVSGVGSNINAIQKKADLTLKKIGTAIVKQEPMEDLWVSPY